MQRPEKPYLARNRDIVLETIALIAAPAEPLEQIRSGTWSTVRFAKKQGKTVILILPDGTIEQR
jgi:predicted Rossmann fold nucleotide-binding protein DprA/Smf involved in DNA uptake